MNRDRGFERNLNDAQGRFFETAGRDHLLNAMDFLRKVGVDEGLLIDAFSLSTVATRRDSELFREATRLGIALEVRTELIDRAIDGNVAVVLPEIERNF